MNELSDDERHLLRYYAETERIIHGPVRGSVQPATGRTLSVNASVATRS